MKNSYNIKIEKVLKFIFGELYFIKIKSFFEQFYDNKKFDFVIFTTRRCHILFCIFDRYFFYNFNHEGISFISDKALHFYNKSLTNSNCAIVDDILIHGRALKSVSQRVKDKNPNKVETFVFLQSEDAKYPADYCVEQSVTKQTWKRFSNKIVSAIIITSFPYTSYIYSSYKELDYESYKELILKCLSLFPVYSKNELSLNEVNNKNELNELLEEYIECYIFDISEYSELYGLEFSCIRIYYNKYLNHCIVTPYCITNIMTSYEIDNILNNYFEPKSKIINVKKHETKYRAITSLYSFAIFHYLLKKHSLDFLSWEQNENYINMSYYDSFFSEIEIILNNNEIRYLKNSEITNFISLDNYIAHKSNNDDILENDVYTSAFISCIKEPKQNQSFYDNFNTNELSKWFYNYLAKVNISEETCFSDTIPEKQLGLSFETIASFLRNNSEFYKKNNFTKFNFYSKLISSADSGFLSIFADYCFYNIEEHKIKIYSNYFITGEHVCRLFQNKYVIFILELIEMFENFTESFKSKFSKKEFFKEFFLLIKNNGVEKNIIENLYSAYEFINESKNNSFLRDSIYEHINDDYLNELLDIGSIIIEESVEL